MIYSVIDLVDAKKCVMDPREAPAEYFEWLHNITSSPNSTIVMTRELWNQHPPILSKLIVIDDGAIPGVTTVQSYYDLDKVLLRKGVEHVYFMGGNARWKYPISFYHVTEVFVASCSTIPAPSITGNVITSSAYPTHRSRSFTTEITQCQGIEEKYLDLLRHVLCDGEHVHANHTLEVHGNVSLSFNLRNGFPLLTTKRMFYRGIVEELLFMISGKTDNRILQGKGVHIWDANSTREYLDRAGLPHLDENDLGKFYGFQWRHWGAEYNGMNEDYTGKGVDQLGELIDGIRTSPHSRRHIISAWNAADLKNVCLPPCHVLYQFHVSGNTLSCTMYQRSADLFLGIPFNIASTSLLTHMIAATCGLKATNITMYFGNAHIYTEHIAQVNEQLRRTAYKLPWFRVKNRKDNIDEYTIDDFELRDYKSHFAITAPLIAIT